MKEPVFVRATALIVVFPNFLLRTLLQLVVVGWRVLKVQLPVRAHLATWVAEQHWMIAPLLIQLAKVLSTWGVGRVYLAVPWVWL